MSKVDSKQVRAEIAAHGFADCMERHGFRKVGATHWRRDSDEVTWRVAIIDKGYRYSPGCFEVMMGGFVHGLDDLGMKVDGEPISSLIQGTSARAHVHRDLGGNVSDMYYSGDADPFDDNLPEPIRQPEFMRRKYKGYTTRDSFRLQDLEENGLVVKHYGRAGSDRTSRAFMVHDRDIREVSEVVTCYFETYFADRLDRWNNFLPIYQELWGPDARYPRPNEYKLNICSAWMAGDQTQIDAIATKAFRKAERTEEDALAELLHEQATVRTRKARPEFLLRNVQAKNRRAGWLTPARVIVQICEGIGAPYPPHNLDFSDIERLHQQARKYIKDNKKELRKYGL